MEAGCTFVEDDGDAAVVFVADQPADGLEEFAGGGRVDRVFEAFAELDLVGPLESALPCGWFGVRDADDDRDLELFSGEVHAFADPAAHDGEEGGSLRWAAGAEA